MNSSSATAFSFDEASTPDANVPTIASGHFPQTLPTKEVVGLCQAMRDAIPFSVNRNSIICFTGPGNDNTISTVAFESALAAASQVNLRVLLVDAVATPEGNREPLLAALRTTLHYALKTASPINDAMMTIRGTHLSYTCLSQAGQGEAIISVLGSFKKLLEELRSSYDLIVINAGPIMNGALGPELAKLSDGTVLVVEAERTRAPVAIRARSIIELSGGRVIGAVLGNRRHHIPAALYKWL